VSAPLGVVIKKGADEKPQPVIAAGYDASAPNPCLGEPARPAKAVTLPSTAPAQAPPSGPSFDLKQSGQFVDISNPQATLSGKLRLREGATDDQRRSSSRVSYLLTSGRPRTPTPRRPR